MCEAPDKLATPLPFRVKRALQANQTPTKLPRFSNGDNAVAKGDIVQVLLSQSELTGGADDGPRASCLCVCVPKGASAKLSRFSTNVAEAEGLETFEDGAPKRGFVQNMFGAPFTMLNRTKPAYDVAFTLVGYPHDNVSVKTTFTCVVLSQEAKDRAMNEIRLAAARAPLTLGQHKSVQDDVSELLVTLSPITHDDERVGFLLHGDAAPFVSSFSRKFVADDQLTEPLVKDVPAVTPGYNYKMGVHIFPRDAELDLLRTELTKIMVLTAPGDPVDITSLDLHDDDVGGFIAQSEN